MDVFLVPVGRETYELYCEHVDETEAPVIERPESFWARLNPRYLFALLRQRFHQMLLDAERERRQERAQVSDSSWIRRTTRRIMRWVAESIAEQRLLWNLRRHDTALLHHPHDMATSDAVAVTRQQLARDFDKHRFWLVIDSLLMVASGLLILIPGPNIVGYYFAFRVVGHYFSLRGARNGLDGVTWAHSPSEPLTELRHALALDAAARLRQAESVASRLRLDHLATFFQRTAASS